MHLAGARKKKVGEGNTRNEPLGVQNGRMVAVGGGGVRGVGSPVMRAAVVGEILGRLKGVLQASSPAQRAGCWAAVFLSLELGGGS